MATYTIAQALATNATGITVVDSPVTIATSLPNPALVARVALFTMSGNSAVAAWEAEVLAGLGSQFSTGGYKLTVRDSVAALTDPANAAGLVIPGAVVAVFDTAAAILAAANNSIIHNASSVALSANATVTLAQLLTLESWPSFTAAGLTITLADSAANLLALTTAEQKPALTVFTVSVNSTVSALSAVSLGALSHFSVASGATLTIADSIANLTSLSSTLTGVLALARVAVNVSDTVANLLGQTAALATIRATMPSVTVSLSDTETATVSQAIALAALPLFSVSAGHALTIADSVLNLLTLTPTQAAIAQFTTLQSSDTASVSQLSALAALPGFSAGNGNVLTVTGSVASLIALTSAQKALVQATTLTASDTANAAQLVSLAALPAFTRGAGHTLVVTDTLSQLGTLTTPQRGLASSSVVDDTVTAILAAQTAHSTVLSAAASVTAELDGNNVTVAQLASLLTLPGLTLHPNVTSSTLTVADSVADLLTLTNGQKALVQATTLLGNDTANAAQLVQLAVLPAFSRGAGHTLVVTDFLTDLGTLTPAQLALASSTVVDDTVTAILAAQTAHSTVLSAAGAVTAELDGNSITVAQLTSLLTLPGVTLHPNVTSSTLTVADSVQHLLTLTTPQKALVQATTLLAGDTANAAQLAQLAALPAFSRGTGHTLVATDTIADFAALTAPQRALASSTVVDDSLTDVLAGLAAHSTVLSAASAVTVELDGTTITVAQAASLLTLPGLTLHPNVTSSVLAVADTMQNLSAGAATLTALGSDGPITLTPTNDHTILTASAAATLITLGGFNPANYTLAVADTGPALSTDASQIFGHGFEAITVTSGSFAGTLAQLLDPTLHFLGGATAQLNANASTNAAQAEALAALPGFARGTGVTLSVQDSIANLVAGATTLAVVATSIAANDTETVSAAGAAALATLQSAVGAAHFSLGGHPLTMADTAQDLLGASAGAVSLATSLALTSDARISESAALQLAVLGGKFSPNAFFITVVDTAANLVALANTPAMLAVVNGWNGGATLSADGGVNVVGAASLLQIGGFNLGTHHLTVSDTAAALLNVNNAAAIALGSTVTLSQAASVTAANAAALAGLAHFSAGGLLSIADNAVNLVAMAASVAAMSSATILLAQPNGDTADYTLNAAQMSTLLALPHFSMSGFAGQLTVVDSAAAMAALAPALAGLPSTSQAHITSELGGDATVSAATAATLAGLPNPINGGHVLTVLDTPTALLAPANAAAFNVASVVGVSAPVTVTVAVANQLAALHGFAADSSAITIADTPANLATLSAATAAIAAQVTVLPYSAGAAADYTINTTQFGALTALQHLSWSGFSGPLTVQDTAGNLAGLATSLSAAQPGSVLSLSHGIISTALSSNGVAIPASEVQQLATLPGFSLNTHSLTVQDTPTNLLLDITGSAVSLVSGVTLAPNSGAWVVAAAAAAQLAAMPGFNAGSAGMQVQDSAFNILAAANAGGVADASSVMLSADATVSASQALALHALHNFSGGSHHLTINDNAFSLLTLDAGTAALASAIQLQGSATVQAAQFLTLSALPGFTSNGSSLNVSDNAAGLLTLIGHNLSQISGTSLLYSASPVTVANAQLLSTLPNLLLGNNLAIADTAANMLLTTGGGSTPDDWAIELQASSVTLTQNALLNAAQATLLAQLGFRFSVGAFTLTVQDSPTALLNLLNVVGPISNQISATTVSPGPWTLNGLSVAAELGTLPHFSAGSVVFTIADTVANLSAGANGNMIDSIIAGDPNALFTLAGNDTATVAQAETLHGFGSYFSRGSSTLTIQDGAGNLATLDSGTAAMASSILLQGSTLTSVANFQKIRALPNYSNNGHTLVVSDTSTNLLKLVGTDVSLASEVMLSTSPASMSAATAEQLATLANFTTGIAHLTILDSVADLVSGSGPQPDDWAGEVAASSITLNGSGSVTAAQADVLAMLGGRFSAGGFTLTVSDSAANLLASANAGGLALAGATALAGNETGLSASAATQLAGLLHFSKNSHSVGVSDTAANLALSSNAPGLALADTVQLSAGASVTVAVAEALLGMGNFVPNGGAPLTIADTLESLLALAGANLANNGSVLAATAIGLSENSVATAAQIQALATLAQYGSFSRNGHTLTVADSGANLATLTHSGVADASSVVMTGAAILTASQADALAALPVSLNSNSLTVADTAAALLNPSNAAGLAIATAITLSGATTVDAADATSLVGNPLFSAGGQTFIVSDTAAALLGLGAPVAAMATTLELSESGDVVTASQLVQLAELGSKFSLNGHTLTVSDTLTHLLALNALETALVSNEVATDSSPIVINAATATALAASAITLSGGATLVVQDTAANLAFAGNSAGLAIANTIQLSSGASLTVAAAEALIGMAHFQINGGAPLTIADTLENLLALAGANLAHNGSVLAATPIGLSENSVATAAEIQTLAVLPQYAAFSRNGYTLTVADSGANLATLTHSGVSGASSVVMTGAAILTATQADALAALPVSLNSNSLTVADTAAALLNPSNAAGLAIATAITLSGATTVDAADAASLVANPLFNAGGQTFIVSDTASALLGLGAPVAAMATTLALSESGDVVTASQLVQLAELGGKFSLNGHTLTVSDTLTHLLALNALETALVSQEVATDSSPIVINAATATALAASAITLTGGATLVVQDTAANLVFAGYSTGLAIADTIQLSTGASLTVAAAETLIGMAHFQTNGAAPITIADTLADLLQLAGASLPHNTGILTTTPIELSANATATVAQMQALAALAQYGSFTLNGYTITVEDSGRHLAAFTADTTAVPSAYVMIGDATLNAIQANSLAAKDVDLDGNNLTLADTPAALLSGANSAGVTLATALTLSGNPTNDTTDATDAMTLAADAKFSTGGHTWIISDNAANLLGLNATTEQMATTLELSGSQSVDVATLVGLTELGVKFSVAGHTLTVSDTAAQLATLSTLETALANGGEMLSADVATAAPVNAATAALLAALPAYSDNGHTLVVRDSVANLIALSASAQAIATTVLLNPGSVTVTAAQGAALAHLANFSTSGAAITVSDTIADLNNAGTAAWHSITSTYTVSDSESNLLANASTALLANATSVTLLADAQVDGATFATLAAIHAFTVGTAILTVVDTPAEIASLAATIATDASGARIDSPTAVSAAQAETLAGLNAADMLSFATGVHLTVQDNYADLTDASNAAGVALASAVVVLDSAAQLVAAATHNWGSATLSLLLSGPDSVTGPQATTLAASGGAFSLNGHALVVADSAAGVAGASAAIHTLGIDAQVTGSIAGTDANSAALIALGGALTSVDITDTASVSALAAAGLSGLAAKLTGNAVTVADNAADVNTNHVALTALGVHLAAVSVTDSAALAGAVSAGLLTLSGTLTVHLNDGVTPVSADVAAGLLPLVANLASGTTINVSDSGAAIANDAAALHSLGTALGTITLSDGTTTGAAVAAAIAPIDAHLGTGVTLTVSDTAAVIAAAAAGLATLQADGKLASANAPNETAAHVVTYGAALAGLGATATIDDSAAAVAAHLDALEPLSGNGGVLRGVTLNDGGSPTVTVSVAQIAADSDVLALITPQYQLTVSDTAAHIQADLIAGGASNILPDLAVIHGIAVSPAGTITLTEAQITAAGVDDGVGSALAKLSGETLAVTGATVAQIPTVLALGVLPGSIAVSDTAAHIQADLIAGGASHILPNLATISGIAVSPSGTITLTEAQLTAAGIDDGAGSALAKMSGETLAVTGVTVAQIPTVLALGVPPASVAVSDTAAHIQADLIAGGASHILPNLADISGIAVSPSGTITLTEAQLTAAGVDDGLGSALAKMSGESLAVTGVTVAQIATVLALGVPPGSIAVTDTAAHIQADLIAAGASHVLPNLATISGIAVSPAGTITLTSAQATVAGVDDGAGSALALMSSETLVVSGVAVADIGTVLGLGVPPASITVSDTAAQIQADLIAGGSSHILPNLAAITGIAVSPSGTITLTEAQLTAAGVDDGVGSALALMSGETLGVTGVTVAQIPTVLALGVPPASIAVTDTAAHIQADLIAGGASHVLPNLATIGSIAVSPSGTITLTEAQLTASGVDDGAGSALALMSGETLDVTGVTVAQIPTVLALGVPPGSIAVSDTAAHIQADLIAGGASHVLPNLATISGIAVSPAGTITLTEAQLTTGGVDDGAGSALAKMSGETLVATGVSVAQVPTVLALGVPPSSIAVADTAAHIQSDLIAGGSSHILPNLSAISGIAVGPAGVITLTEAQVTTASVDDGPGSAMALMSGATLAVTDVTVAQIPTMLALGVPPGSIAVSDTAAHVQADLIAGGSSQILPNLAAISGIAVSPSGGITLTEAQLTAAGVDDGVGSALALMTGETLAVTGVTVAQIPTMLALGVPPASIAVSDTAAHIQADLIAGGSSHVLPNLAAISGIAVSPSGTITLTEAQLTAAGVDDGVGSALALMTGETLAVTGVTVAQVAAVVALGVPPNAIAVSDTAAQIQADLIAGGSSNILPNLATISGIAVSPSGTVTLTEAQLTAAGVDDGAGSALAKMSGETLAVTGVTVAQIPTMLALGVPPGDIAVSDTAAHIQADLIAGGSSLILPNLASISGIAVSPSGTITLTEAQLTAPGVDDGVGSALALMTGETLAVTGVTVAQVTTVVALGVPPNDIAVSDTAAHIQADLIAGGSSHILPNLSTISGIAVSPSGTITLTEAQLVAAGVDDGVGSALAKMSGETLAVTGVAVAQIATVLALGVPPTGIAVSDTAAHIQADLIAGGSSHILPNLVAISGIAVSPSGTITLTEAQLIAAGVDDGAGSALALMSGETLAVTGVTVAQIPTVLALGVPPASIAVSDTAAHIQADLIVGGSSQILPNLAAIGSIAVSPSGTITLTEAQLTAAGVDDGVGSALAKMSGETLAVTGVALAQIEGLLALGVPPSSIAVSDSAAHVQSDLTGGLSEIFGHTGLLSGISLTDGGTPALTFSVDQLTACSNVLGLIHTAYGLAISGPAADIETDLASGNSAIVAHIGAIQSLTVSDSGIIHLTAAQVLAAWVDDGPGSALALMTGGSLAVSNVAVADVGTILALGVAPASIAISDTAAHIQADLIAGGSSHILPNLDSITGIAVSPSGSITLTSAQVQAAGVDDGPDSALALMTGDTLAVSGVAVADIGTILGLGVPPASITVSDTAAQIQADLIAGGSSHVLPNLAAITGIAVSPAGTITLTEAQLTAVGVDDGIGSALAKMSGETLAATGVTVAQIATVLALGVAPTDISVSDSAAHIQADLIAGASSHVLPNLSTISGIAVSPSGTITLNEAQLTAAGVDDGVGSALAKMTGETLAVTGVTVAQVPAMLALGVTPTDIGVSDSAAHIQADLIAGGSSHVLSNLADISGIAVSPSGTITLTDAQVSAAGVDDGAGSALDKMSGETLAVTGVTVAQIATMLALGVPPASMAISDTAAHIQADLIAGGGSFILPNLSSIGGIAVSPAATITLTEAQLTAAGVDDGVGSALAKMSGETLAVTGVTVAQIASVLGLGVPPADIAVTDTAAHIQADLIAGGASYVLPNLSTISGIAVSPSGTITLTEAQLTATGVDDGIGSALALMTGETLAVTNVAVAQIPTVLALGVPPVSISVSDTAAHIQADLIAGGSSQILPNLSTISGIAVSPGGTITLTSAQVQAAGVDDGPGSALARTSGETLVVSGVAVADIGTILGLGVPPASIAVSDTASQIQADLIAGGSSHILPNLASITGIAVSPAGTITLTEAQLTAVGVDDGVGSALALMSGETLAVTGVTVAQIASVLGLGVPPADIAVSDTAAHIQADLIAGGSSYILPNLSTISGIAVSPSGAITLTEAQLTAAGVDDGVGSALAKMSGETLAVTGVTVAQIATMLALGVVPADISVSDTAAHIQADLIAGGSSHILPNLATISGIAVSPPGTITLSEAQVDAAGVDDGVGSALAKMSGETLAVTGVAVADIGSILGLGVAPASITVSDTAAHIQADLIAGGSSHVLPNLASITGIAVSPSGTITLTEAQLTAAGVDDGVGSALALMSGETLAVTDVTVAQIATVLGLGVPPASIAISDTAAHIQADLIAGGSSYVLPNLSTISGIAVSPSGTVTLTEAQLTAAGVDDGVGSALAKMSGETLAVTGVTVAQIPTVLALGVPPGSIVVSDTAAHIQADLIAGGSSYVLPNLSTISGIAVSPSGTVTLTEAQLTAAGVDDGAGSALALMSGETLAVTGVTVAQIPAVLALGVPPASIAVTDTAAHIQADLIAGGSSHVLPNLATIGSIAVSPAGTVTLTDAQAQAAGVDDGVGSALAKMSGETLVVTGVAVADIGTILGLGVTPASITVADAAASILADLGLGGSSAIASNSGVITAVQPTDASLDVATATSLYNDLLGVTAFNESGLTITGTAANLLTAHGSIPTLLSAAALVTMTGNPVGLTAAQATALSGILGGVLAHSQTMAIADTPTHLLDAANSAGIALATTVALNAPASIDATTATALAGLHAFDAAGPAITIHDTPTNLLNAAYSAGLAIATTVTPDTDYTISATTLADLAAISGIATGGHSITVQDSAANVAGLSQTALNLTSLASVSDTSADVAANLAGLQSAVTAHSHPLSIVLSDGTPGIPTITVNAATYTADAAVLDAITTAGAVKVVDSAAALTAIAGTLASDAAVGEVDVSDSAADILSNLTALDSIGSKFKLATISDTTVNASTVAGLLTIPNLATTGSLTISDTGSQIAAAIEANGAPGLTFLNNHTVALSANSVITASDAVALEQLSNLQKEGYTLAVWDTATHLTDSVDGYLAAVKNGLINAVYLKTIGGTATITASTAATLLSILTFSKNNPPVGLGGNGALNTLTVLDTAAHIDSAFSALNGHTSSVSGIVVSASATVTDAVYGDLLTLGATMTGGQFLTVRDTAATIIASAPTQLGGGHSITPTAWQLSGSATVTEAGAAFLGGLTGLSTGAYTLTLQASDLTTSVADANAIGVLGSAFHLGVGHQLGVNGTVSYVSGLSANAKLVVTPAITDAFTPIATLTLGDGLLDGTIAVNDSEAVTTTQAADFLALLGGFGIPIANVSFGGNVESITDTLTNIQALTVSANWIADTSVHSDFHLVVADSVANLIDPANTTALAAMNGTTLATDETISAANAESLFAVESTIQFSLGSHAITIQDSAADLLNPSNVDGEALAASWQLSGNDSVSAAGAETLLSEAKFHVNHLLTVNDTSADLLDGVLAGVITGSGYSASIHVTLSDAETLDANTAEALVSLPGFTNTGELSIADSSAYLLNPNNLSAETDATSVTLAGDETVSASTASRLAGLPNFALDGNTLHLASNDYANAATLKAIADFASGFDPAGHSLSMTQDALNLTPDEYSALQNDNVVLNGHALSALPTGVSVAEVSGNLQISGTGVSGATLTIYSASGSVLTTSSASPGFVISAAESGSGINTVVTETVGESAATSESAPIIVLEQAILTTDAGVASFAASGGAGMVQVGGGEYMHLYTAGAQPASPVNPVLVYDPVAHTLSFDVASSSVVLVTLGAATHPASLDPSEIFVKHYS